MSEPEPRREQRNAGAFLGPDMLAPVPMRTLSDDYHDERAEPQDDRVPEPEPPSLIHRLVDRLRLLAGPGH
jgi:hypothetical protein